MIAKRKRNIVLPYRPHYNRNKTTFFKEINNLIDIITRTYKNIIIAANMNTDFSKDEKDYYNYLFDLCDIFSMKNLIFRQISVKSTKGVSVDVIVPNWSSNLRRTRVTETGHNLIFSFFRAYFQRIPPKNN